MLLPTRERPTDPMDPGLEVTVGPRSTIEYLHTHLRVDLVDAPAPAALTQLMDQSCQLTGEGWVYACRRFDIAAHLRLNSGIPRLGHDGVLSEQQSRFEHHQLTN